MKELESLTGVGREAVRFYIKQGILPPPDKPKKNVAHYSEEHVLRIKTIRKLQEEKFLPLGVIKNILNTTSFAQLSTAGNLTEFELAFSVMLSDERGNAKKLLKDVKATLGFSEPALREMHELKIIAIVNDDAGESLDAIDIKVLEHWRQILSMGYDQGAGYDLQFLKRYVDMSRALAEQEVSLFFKEFSSLPVKQAAKLGSEGIKIGNNLIGLLHTREVRKCVQQFVKRQSNENSKT